ncbi:MAG: hypothetical protein GY765_37790 [bacterium]|nr:hypothetical protein [bacterium]
MNNVKILTHKGEFIETFGRLGKGPSDLDTPGKITHAGNNVVVWEAGNRRFSIFSKDGKFVKSSKMEHAGYCRIIKSLDNGDVVLERVKTVRENKKYIQLVSLDLYSPDMEFKKILYRQKVYRMNYINRKNIIVPFAPDIYWDVAPGNKIVVGFSDQYKLKIIDTEKMDDKPFSHAYTPIKVTEADKEDFFSGITWGASGETTKRGASKFTREHTEFPEYKPAFRGVLCDPEGNILVVCTNGGTDLNAKYLDAFDSSGTFISRVEVVNKNGLSLLLGYQFSKDKHLWTVERRDDVDSVIVKYKLK